MSAKRFNSRGVSLRSRRGNEADRFAIIVLLAIALIGGGCATTSSQTAIAPKPHKPQMITADGVEQVGGFKLPDQLDHGFTLSDGCADVISFFGWFLQFLTGNPSG
jgi:hypothetical protein